MPGCQERCVAGIGSLNVQADTAVTQEPAASTSRTPRTCTTTPLRSSSMRSLALAASPTASRSLLSSCAPRAPQHACQGAGQGARRAVGHRSTACGRRRQTSRPGAGNTQGCGLGAAFVAREGRPRPGGTPTRCEALDPRRWPARAHLGRVQQVCCLLPWQCRVGRSDTKQARRLSCCPPPPPFPLPYLTLF